MLKFPPPLKENPTVEEIKKFFAETQVKSLRFRDEISDILEKKYCGQMALAYLTGNSTYRVRTELPDKLVTDEQAVAYLRKRGFVVTELTAELMQPEPGLKIHNFVKDGHVILSRVHSTRDSTTWLVSWAGITRHNFSRTAESRSAHYNMKPIISFMVYHPTWYRLRSFAEVEVRFQELHDIAGADDLITEDDCGEET